MTRNTCLICGDTFDDPTPNATCACGSELDRTHGYSLSGAPIHHVSETELNLARKAWRAGPKAWAAWCTE